MESSECTSTDVLCANRSELVHWHAPYKMRRIKDHALQKTSGRVTRLD